MNIFNLFCDDIVYDKKKKTCLFLFQNIETPFLLVKLLKM